MRYLISWLYNYRWTKVIDMMIRYKKYIAKNNYISKIYMSYNYGEIEKIE